MKKQPKSWKVEFSLNCSIEIDLVDAQSTPDAGILVRELLMKLSPVVTIAGGVPVKVVGAVVPIAGIIGIVPARAC